MRMGQRKSPMLPNAFAYKVVNKFLGLRPGEKVLILADSESDGDYVYRCEYKSITPGYTSGDIMIGAETIATTSKLGYGRTPLIEGNTLGVKGGITHLKKDEKVWFRVACHDASKLQLVALDIDVKSFSST